LIPVDVIEGFEPKKSAPPPRSSRKPNGWKPGENRNKGGKPGQRTFSKPGSSQKEGGFGKGPRSGASGEGYGARRSYGDRQA
jgi:hypothetical protein